MIEAMSDLPLKHIVRQPLDGAGAAPPPALILLHGYGSNESDLFSLSPYLDERFLIVSPRGPHTLSPGSYAWFNLDIGPNGLRIDQAEADASRLLLIQFIQDAVKAYGADARRVYLMGFSQGASMSLNVMLSAPELLAGVVAMSGFLLPNAGEHPLTGDRVKDFPVMVVHGLDDDLVPVAQGRACRDALSDLHVALTYREYPMGHQTTDESLDDVSQWLSGAVSRLASADSR